MIYENWEGKGVRKRAPITPRGPGGGGRNHPFVGDLLRGRGREEKKSKATLAPVIKKQKK